MFVQTLETLPITFAERRRAVRRRPAHNTICRLSNRDDNSEIGCGLVWNLSTTGISLLLNVPLQPGTWVRAELQNHVGETRLVAIRVVHLNRLRTGDYVLGGQFAQPLDDDELTPFVV